VDNLWSCAWETRLEGDESRKCEAIFPRGAFVDNGPRGDTQIVDSASAPDRVRAPCVRC